MLSKYNWMSLITGVLLVVISLYLFSNPEVPLAILGSTFAVVILLAGVFELVRYFGAPKSARNIWELIGAVGMIAWSLLMLNSSDSARILPIFMGLCLLIWTSGRICAALMLKTIIPGAARHMLFSAAGVVVVSIAMIQLPMLFGVAVVWLAALALLVTGLVFVGDFFVSRRTQRTVHISPDGVIDVEAK